MGKKAKAAKKAAPKKTPVQKKAEQVQLDNSKPVIHPQESVMDDKAKSAASEKPDDKATNDKLENVVRDPVLYQGQTVSYVKDIGNGDPEFDANIRKVMITMPSGEELVVPESEILRKGSTQVPADATTLNRPDNPPKSNLEQPKVR